MATEPDKKALLGQLRIERDAPAGAAAAGRGPWLVAVLLLLVLLIAGGAWFAFGARAAVPVRTSVAQPMGGGAGNASVLDATGYVTARREATVSAQITGSLTQVLIEEGDHVKAGQVLARLDDTAQRATLAQAQAQVRAAHALLVQEQAQLAQSERDARRADDLVKRNLVSQQAVEQARTQVETGTAQVQGQSRQIELAEANLRAAQVQFDYCTVRAPFTGVVIAKAAQVGEIVSPFSAGGGFTRTGIGTLVDMESLEIEVDVNEAYINRVQPGQPVESVLNAYPDWKIPSHVIAIIPTADRSKATVKVRIGLDVKDERIVPDMGVRVSFLEDKQAPAQPSAAPRGVLVPASAVRSDGDRQQVFVVKDRHAQLRTVSAGGVMGASRQIVNGLAAGESVIVEPPTELKDGAAVTVAK